MSRYMDELSSSRDCVALSNLLLCHESESPLDEIDERSELDPHCYLVSDVSMIGDNEEEDDDDYVAKLVRKENQRCEIEPKKTTSAFNRLIAIDWILTTRTRFGFQHQTAYIAISYFDLFLQRRFIGRDESWAIRLLSVACLSLAAKMEERIVPELSHYPQDHDFAFKPDVLCKTELLILSTLDWKMNIITPFHYLNYFITKISSQHNQSVSKELILLGSSESLIALTKEIEFSDYRQFVVAAATTLLASPTSLDIKLTREDIANKFGSITWWTSNENENVYLCYQRMVETEERKHIMTPPEIAVSKNIQTPEIAVSKQLSIKCLPVGLVSTYRF